MATNIVDIENVEPDIDPMEIGIVSNPLSEDFTHNFAGKPLTIPAVKIEEVEKDGKKVKIKTGGSKQFPLPAAVHLADHLAQRIVREEFRKNIDKIKDEKKKEIEAGKPIPDFRGKVWVKMKELVETESDFFEEKGEGKDGNKEKFLK